ncbi:MAG: hypothetical protein HKN68_15120 [Saprospiraceae bacterium]|nr:hypothetical protein [Saprospiraceae bacterium]
MTVEFNIDDRNSMLIAIIAGNYDFEKVGKVINMALERCLEKDLHRALIDMAQIKQADSLAVEKLIFSREMFTRWGSKVKMCLVYDHKLEPEFQDKMKEGPDGWCMITANKNQSVFWLLAH